MKVLLMVPSLRKTGVTEVIKSLIVENAKQENGVTFYLMALRQVRPSDADMFTRLLGKKLILLDGDQYISLSKILKVRKIIQKLNPDVVHFHGFNAEIYLPFVRSNRHHWVSTAHNLGAEDFVSTYGRIPGSIMATVQKILYHHLDAVVGVSRTVSAHYRGCCREVITIYNGVPSQENTNPAKEHHASPVGVYAGNLDQRKNIKFLLEAARHVGKDFPFTLVVLGDNPQDPTCVQKLKEQYGSKNILFQGRVNNVGKYLSKADFFISASKSEGLPMAVLEAMKFNLDLILSNIPQHRELRIADDQDIYFFGLKEVSSLEKVLSSYLRQWQPGHVSNNQRIFLQHFTAQKMYISYVGLYKKLIDG